MGGTFIQMEDEIASVSAIVGASWTGLKSMTATSGPGLSLMMEGLSYIAGTEVPYPGWADVSYLAGYPVIFVGILLMPHVRMMRYERIRLTLDALAGTVALAAIMWTLYLHRVVYFDADAGLLERYVNIAYPFADVVLLVALLLLAIRRTARR